ncbi:MAG: hypothetical protein ACR2G3_01045 [Solirubrobacterales bacterium]
MIPTGLAAGRIAIGAGLWAAPRLSLRALGFHEPTAETIAIARVAGVRDLVIGAWQLRSIGDDAELRRTSAAAAACDAGDTLAFGLLLADGNRRAGLLGLAAAAPATVANALLARGLRR